MQLGAMVDGQLVHEPVASAAPAGTLSVQDEANDSEYRDSAAQG